MKDIRLFMDKKKNYFVVGKYQCKVCDSDIEGWAALHTNYRDGGLYCPDCIKKPKYAEIIKLTRTERVSVNQFILVVVANEVDMSWVIVVPRMPTFRNFDGLSTFDVDKIDSKRGGVTVDKTVHSNREYIMFDDTVKIGSPDVKRLEELDKPIDDEGEVDALFEDVLSSEIVVDDPRLLEDKKDA